MLIHSSSHCTNSRWPWTPVGSRVHKEIQGQGDTVHACKDSVGSHVRTVFCPQGHSRVGWKPSAKVDICVTTSPLSLENMYTALYLLIFSSISSSMNFACLLGVRHHTNSGYVEKNIKYPHLQGVPIDDKVREEGCGLKWSRTTGCALSSAGVSSSLTPEISYILLEM